ncbi:MAG TPA: hypothetical protein PLB11_13405, partial [Flavobacterium sp.]|nr:hypothetical protein [Flavobacterium sp.]
MKKLIMICLFMAVSIAYSQGHQSGGKWCCPVLGTRCDGVGTYLCPLCEKNQKKEKEAKAAEDKRRTDAAYAKAEADKRTREIARKKEQQELAEKNKSTEVFVTMPKAVSSPKNNSAKNEKQVVPQKVVKKPESEIFMRAMNYGEGFWNAKNLDETVILKKERDSWYRGAEGAMFNDGCGIQFGFPPNIGIVTFNNEIQVAEPFASELNTSSYYVQDLIDRNEKRIFNSDRIASIEHFYGNWFLIGYDVEKYFYVSYTYASAKLYNVKTKEYVDISEKSYSNTISLSNIKFHGRESVVAPNYRYIFNVYQAENNSCYTFSRLSSSEVLMKNKLGGEEKWKAFIIVNPISSKSDINFDRYIYYCDQNNKIIKMKIT